MMFNYNIIVAQWLQCVTWGSKAYSISCGFDSRPQPFALTGIVGTTYNRKFRALPRIQPGSSGARCQTVTRAIRVRVQLRVGFFLW